jgi:hypothetical protein
MSGPQSGMMSAPDDSGVDAHGGENRVRLRRRVDGAGAHSVHGRQALAVPVVVVLAVIVPVGCSVVGFASGVTRR